MKRLLYLLFLLFGMALMIGCDPVETRRATYPQDTPSAEEAAIDSLRADSLFNVAQSFYQNGLDNYGLDSSLFACKECYHALSILEDLYSLDSLPETEQLTPMDKKMISLLSKTYRQIGSLYSIAVLPEQTSYFYNQDLIIKKKYSKSPKSFGSTLFLIGYEFDVCDRLDSASYYYDSAMVCFNWDTADFIFRLASSRRILIDYKTHRDAFSAIRNQKIILQHCESLDYKDVEMNIGYIYKEEKQYDSAVKYLQQAFDGLLRSSEKNEEAKQQTAQYLYEVYEIMGDTEKMNEYANYLAQSLSVTVTNSPTTKELTELFNNYIQKKQGADTLLQKRQTQRKNLLIGAIILLVFLALGWVLWVTHKRHKQTEADLREEHQQQQEAFDQQRETFNQQLSEAQTALKQKTFEDLKKQAQLLYDKGGHPRQSILDAFNKAYPDVYEKLKATYPDLTEQERDLLVLNFLQFRIKEEAEILDLSENTVMKYRSHLNKKVGKSPVFDLLG